MAEAGKVGVVTVTYNAASVVDGFLASLLSQSYRDFALYVVDNASADDTLARLGHYADPRVTAIANRQNLGVAAANNQGITAALAAGCGSVLLVNNDTEFAPDLLQALKGDLDEAQRPMVVPKIRCFDPADRLWYAGGSFSTWRGYATLHRGKGEPDHGQYDVSDWVEYAPTCCMLVNGSVFQRIGLMDEVYFLYFDDADFTFRAKKAGLRIWYDPAAVIRHKESSLTGGARSPVALHYSARNKLYFLQKNVGRSWIGWAAAYQVYLALRLLSRRDSRREFALRQQSFAEGLRLASQP
jgi:GT2 family glycosyltransferase